MWYSATYNPRQNSLAHQDQMARKYTDKVFWGQYLMASLELANPPPPQQSCKRTMDPMQKWLPLYHYFVCI